jgi:hypothetical protein
MLGRVPLVRTRQIASVLVLVLLPARSATADNPRDAARTRYARGLELAGAGVYEAALQMFNEAYALSPQFPVLYNIGEAQAALGRYPEAIETFSEYLRDGQERIPRQRRQQVKALIALLTSRLADVSITADRPDARITIDGREVGSTPLPEPVRVAPGTHTISAAADGAPPLVKVVTLREAEHQTLALVLPAPSPKTAAAAARAAVVEAVAAVAAARRAAADAEAAARVAVAAAQSPAERARAAAATRAGSSAAARAASAAAAAEAAEFAAHGRATPGGGGR